MPWLTAAVAIVVAFDVGGRAPDGRSALSYGRLARVSAERGAARVPPSWHRMDRCGEASGALAGRPSSWRGAAGPLPGDRRTPPSRRRRFLQGDLGHEPVRDDRARLGRED